MYDQDGSQQSQDLLKRFQASEYFHIVRAVDNYARHCARARLRRGQDGHCHSLELLAAAEPGRSGAGAGACRRHRRQHRQRAHGLRAGRGAGLLNRRSARLAAGARASIQAGAHRASHTRTWYNEDLESSAFIIPGVLALVMSVIGAFLTSLTIAREWERGSMEQLISTPVTAMEIMLGKLAPYFVLGMIDVAVCAVLAIGWFHVPFRGSYLTLAVCSALVPGGRAFARLLHLGGR